MGYHPAVGGSSAPSSATADSFILPNYAETQILTVPAGTVGWMTLGDPVYVTDGTVKIALIIVAVYPADPGDPTVQFVELRSATPSAGVTVGACTIYSVGAP